MYVNNRSRSILSAKTCYTHTNLPPNPGVLAPKALVLAGVLKRPPAVWFCCPNRPPLALLAAGVPPNAEIHQ